MDTRGKSNMEFRNEVGELLARHESRFDQVFENFNQVNTTLQNVLAEFQAMRCTHHQSNIPDIGDVNPFATGEPSHRNHTPVQSLPQQTSLKLQFPQFSGQDPNSWIYRAEKYFDFQNIHPNQRVQLASFHLEGLALQWHRWITKFRGSLSWDDFTKALLRRFGPTDYDDPSEALTRLKQTSTVDVYQHEFERLSQLVDNLPEPYLIGCFIAGLKDEIRLDLKIKKPRSLSEAIGVARLIEERNNLEDKSSLSSNPIIPPTTSLGNNTTTDGLLGASPSHPNHNTMPFKKINGQEARDRREKGLCYYCNEKYAPGHKCRQPQFYMIEDPPPTQNPSFDMPITKP
ncbi:hypothetical protein ACHQM5_022972 [Ranunculus cassubicifolius]